MIVEGEPEDAAISSRGVAEVLKGHTFALSSFQIILVQVSFCE